MKQITGALLFSATPDITLLTQTAGNYGLILYCVIFILLFFIIMLYGRIYNYKTTVNATEKKVRKYKAIFQSMQEGFVLLEIIFNQAGEPENYRLIDANPAAMLIAGLEKGEIIDRTFFELLPQAGAEGIERLNKVALTGEPISCEVFVNHIQKYLLVDIYKPEKDRIAVMFSDITRKSQAESLAERQKLRLEALFKNSSDAIILFDSHQEIIDINEKFTELFGYTIDEIRGKKVDMVVASEAIFDKANKLTSDLLNGHDISMESVRFGADGQPREVSIKGITIKLNNEIIRGYGIYTDISQRKKAEREILYMNYHDQLTNLYNRRFFEEELRRLDTERNLPISIIMADVNGLKLYNDAFGHVEGDNLLIKAAELIKKECREDEIIARLGGDEFVILLPKTNSEEAKRIIKRIKTSGSEICLKSMELSISLGWSTKKSVDQDINELLKNAEDNMYKNKLSEKSGVKGKAVQAIINSFHDKNKIEEQHSKRVSRLCEAIGIAMGKSESELNVLRTAGLLHDIGKIAICEEILNKPDQLTEEEWNEIKRHPEIGYRILKSVNDKEEIAEFVLAHHERWDGKGYPKGIKGEEIPLIARIIAVACAYDSMTSKRPYRNFLPWEEAAGELKKNAGAQFDPEIVKIFTEKVIGKES